MLLRWIYDKPLYVRPPLGSPPSFSNYSTGISRASAALYNKTAGAMRRRSDDARFLFEDYLKILVDETALMTPQQNYTHLDDEIVRIISESAPIRNEYISLLGDAARYVDDDNIYRIVHKFLELMLSLKSIYIGSSADEERDAIKFFTHEIFILTIAKLIQNSRFTVVSKLLDALYYVSPDYNKNSTINSFTEFREPLPTLNLRNNRLNLQRISLRSDLIKDRITGDLPLQDVMQADFLCLVKSSINNPNSYSPWWPDTLIFAARMREPFEIFARATSASYLNNVLSLLNLNDLGPIDQWLAFCKESPNSLPKWEFHRISPQNLLNRANLGSRR
jgi:hypothetical protein